MSKGCIYLHQIHCARNNSLRSSPKQPEDCEWLVMFWCLQENDSPCWRVCQRGKPIAINLCGSEHRTMRPGTKSVLCIVLQMLLWCFPWCSRHPEAAGCCQQLSGFQTKDRLFLGRFAGKKGQKEAALSMPRSLTWSWTWVKKKTPRNSSFGDHLSFSNYRFFLFLGTRNFSPADEDGCLVIKVYILHFPYFFSTFFVDCLLPSSSSLVPLLELYLSSWPTPFERHNLATSVLAVAAVSDSAPQLYNLFGGWFSH